MHEKIVLRKQADDCLIVKEIQHGQVKTQNVIAGKPGYTTRKDIRRMGYADTAELVEYLKQQGYSEC